MASVTKAAGLHLRGRRRASDDGEERPATAGGAARGTADYTALITDAAEGRRDALEALLMRAQDVAYRFGLTVCGHVEDAEDVMQDALVRTYRHVGRIRNPEAFRSWLYRTVRNACLMKRRRRVQQPAAHVPLDDLLAAATPVEAPAITAATAAATDPEARLVNRRLRGRLQRALAQLPASHRAVVFLRDMEGLSTREAAEVLGVSEANVKTRLYRARLFLQRELGGQA
jgi:RNA polymerase sigma-70 factor (ECF subfamily)